MDSSITTVQPTEQSLRGYWIFFSGQLFSLFGSSVVQFAIIWWLTLTSADIYPGKTGFILSLASVSGFLPFVLTSLVAGVLVDRWNRKLVIGAADFLQALVTGLLLILFLVDLASIPVVLIVLAIRAVGQGFHSPATQAIIPLMVPKEQFTKVNSYQYLFNSVINLIGPVVGAVVVELVGVQHIGMILWLDMISFLVALIPLLLITIPDITKEKREQGEAHFVREFKEGIAVIVNHNGLLPLLLTFTLINILVAPVFMLLPLVVISPDLLNADATILGIIMAASQLGTISASLVFTKRKLFESNVNGVLIGQFCIYSGVIFMGIGILLGNLYILIAGTLLNGLALPLANVHSQNIWLAVVPPELQGRVMSVRQTIAWVLIPLAQLIGGYLADLIGPTQIYLFGAGIGTIVLLIIWVVTDLYRVEPKQRDEQLMNRADTEISDTMIT